MLTRFFENDNYELLDFSMSQNIFGFLEGESIREIRTVFELYNETAAEQLQHSTFCTIGNTCEDKGEECEDTCGGGCKKGCNVNCVQNHTAMVCTFTFDPVFKETTIRYRFDSDFDLNEKYLHIMRVVPPKETCKLADFDDNLNMKICSYHKVNKLKLYLNEDFDSNCGCDCSGYEVLWKDNDPCTDISVPHTYFSENQIKIQAIRNRNVFNSFTIETDTVKLDLLKEIMWDYQGKLIAQLSGQQIIKYIFPSDSDVSKIKQIILTHRTNGVTFIVDETSCKVGDSAGVLECWYELQDKIDVLYLGLYDISYYHKDCSEEFKLTSPIEIEQPPIILSSVTPTYSWLGSITEFELTYYYYFYDNFCSVPKRITLVNVNDETQTQTVSLYNKESRKHLYFKSRINFLTMGNYYIIEHFDCLENKVHKDKTILFYLHEIEISPPNVTYYTDEPKPESTTTYFVKYPIINEQIASVTLEGRDVQYSSSGCCASGCNISFCEMAY